LKRYEFVIFASGAWSCSVLVNGSAIPNQNGVPATITVSSGPVAPALSQILNGNVYQNVEAGTIINTELQALDQVTEKTKQKKNDILIWSCFL
jgi:hypothetical protein